MLFGYQADRRSADGVAFRGRNRGGATACARHSCSKCEMVRLPKSLGSEKLPVNAKLDRHEWALAIGAVVVAGYLFWFGLDLPWSDQSLMGRAQRLGSAKFSPDAWRGADARVRGTMVADLLKAHNFVGGSGNGVSTVLGSSTCYWDHDDPCYLVESRGGFRRHMLVFGLNRSDRPGTVSDVYLWDY